MPKHFALPAAILLLPLLAIPAARAAEPPPPASSVKPNDVNDDKGRSGPDGYVQAPIPRTDASSGKAPSEDKPNRSSESQTRNVPDTGKNLPPGQDPFVPFTNGNPGPSGLNPSAPQKGEAASNVAPGAGSGVPKSGPDAGGSTPSATTGGNAAAPASVRSQPTGDNATR